MAKPTGASEQDVILPIAKSRVAECPDLGFTQRWLKGNDEALRRGGWHLHVASSQQGKSVANRIYCRSHEPTRSEGRTHAEVIGIVAPSDGRGSLARLIALEAGGAAYARTGQLERVVPELLQQVGNRLLIINNGHQLGWRQWQQLLTIDDHLARLDHRVAIVFSSVMHDLTQIPGLPAVPELVEQIIERIKCRQVFDGCTDGELQDALGKLLGPHDPKLALSVARHYELVKAHLLRPATNPYRHERVGIGRVVDLVRWMVAVHRKHPTISAEAVIRRAYTLYIKELLATDAGAKLAEQLVKLREDGAAA